MVRFQRRNPVDLQVSIIVLTLAVFVADLLTPLGVAVWVFYLISVALTLLGRQPVLPLVTAAVSTGLILIGALTDSSGIAPSIATANRTFGVVTIWTTAFIGRNFLNNKLLIEEQKWLRKGQTQLAEQLHGEQLLPALCNKVIAFLCRYLDASVGVVYVATDTGVFQQSGSYAFDPVKDSIETIVRPGEGLAGQVLKDMRPLVVSHVPADHIHVRSALGSSKPVALLIVPATAEGEVDGVIELGFLRPVLESDQKLMELVAEPIGMAVRASRYRTQLEMLLRETQRQAEELQAQSEELRVANEELEEQSRILRDSQSRLESQQSELEATNTQLEEQTQLLERQKADLTVAQTALAEHAAELARASQYKSEFLANMSHELRTPLNSSLILSKLLADNKMGNLTQDQVKFAKTIYSAGNDLLDLINDILDLSKIEAGRVSIYPEPVAVEQLLEDLSKTFKPIAEEKSLQFIVSSTPDAPTSITTDVQRLEQILKNLVSNAIKFTDTGNVTVRAVRKDEGQIAFTVEDTGIGIAKSQQGVIFEAFRQADGGRHRRFGGTGLGLSISRDLSKLLGGEITVESEPGRGSVFTLILPEQLPSPAESLPPPMIAQTVPTTPRPAETTVAAPEAPKAAPPADDRSRVSATGRTLLVIEDDQRFASILYDLAHEEGFECLVAHTANDGIALARKYLPKAIVLDVNLPDQSGLYVLEQLKRDPAARHIPVHVLSVDDYRRTALELGAVSYAMKPAGREGLIAAMRRIEAKFDQTVRRVLVVENNDTERQSIEHLLALPGIEVTAVPTAAEALEHLRQSTFDCMVMDLGLEDMSGYDLLDRMAHEETYSFPPVIVYTGRSLEAPDEHRLRRYSRSIIIKGARSPERLLDEVTLFLHHVESRLPPDQQKILRQVRDRDTALEGRRILIVEDDVRNVFAITSILEPRGARVEIARTGKEALTFLDNLTDRKERVDLILMDLMMPEMDGLTATKEIRARQQWAQVPIIAITAKAMPDDREQCIRAGANDYISKPVDVDKLLSLIRVWLPKA